MTKRDAMTSARRARILAKTGGKCARSWCEDPAVQIDHIIPLNLARPGDEEHRKRLEADGNLQGLCAEHHQQKSSADQKVWAKARRRAEETCAGPTKRPLKGRGFPEDAPKRAWPKRAFPKRQKP